MFFNCAAQATKVYIPTEVEVHICQTANCRIVLYNLIYNFEYKIEHVFQ